MTITVDGLDPGDLGQRLQRARKQRGLTQADAAALIDVARTTLTAIEQGKRRIKPDELIALARAYGRQVGEFVRPEAPMAPFQVAFRSANLRGLADDGVILAAIDRFEEYCRDYLALEELTASPLPQRYPPAYTIGVLGAEQAGEIAAQEERSRMGLGDGPLLQLRAMLEQDVGLRIFYMPLQPSGVVAAMYSYTADLGGCIAVNSLHPEERRRWSLAHDYAHFLIERHQPDITLTEKYVRRPESERFADSFAVSLLMPASGLLRRFNRIRDSQQAITPGDLCLLAHYYAVSVETLTRRLEDLRALPAGTWNRLRDSGFRVREAQRQLGLESHEAYDDLLPKRYQYLTISALDKGLISEGEFARFLHVDRLKARQIAELLRQEASIFDTGAPIDLNNYPAAEESLGD